MYYILRKHMYELLVCYNKLTYLFTYYMSLSLMINLSSLISFGIIMLSLMFSDSDMRSRVDWQG